MGRRLTDKDVQVVAFKMGVSPAELAETAERVEDLRCQSCQKLANSESHCRHVT